MGNSNSGKLKIWETQNPGNLKSGKLKIWETQNPGTQNPGISKSGKLKIRETQNPGNSKSGKLNQYITIIWLLLPHIRNLSKKKRKKINASHLDLLAPQQVKNKGLHRQKN